jgi:hypothetical protein
MTARADITLGEREAFGRVYDFAGPPGQPPTDWTGSTLSMGIKAATADGLPTGPVLMLLTTENGGITILDPPQDGKLEIVIDNSEGTLAPGSYVHDLWRIVGGKRARVWKGSLTVEVAVTPPSEP